MMTKLKHSMFIGVLFSLFMTFFLAASPAQALIEFNPECKELAAYQAEALENRWWKPVFDIVSDATVKIGEESFSRVAKPAITLMAVGFGLWLAIFTMKMVGSLKEQDPMEYLTSVGGMLFKCAFAAVFLRNSGFFFGYIVAPITAIGAGFAGLDAGAGEGLASVVAPLSELMEEMHKAVANGIGLGEGVECLSIIVEITIIVKIAIIPDFPVYLSGCMLKTGCWLLLIAFPFRIFDALFRLGVTAALCPLFIVSWVFPATAGFAKKGLNSILHVTFLFLCLKIILDLDIEMLLGATGLRELSGVDPKTAMDKFRATGSEKKPSNPDVIIMAVCIFYSILFLLKADELANYFAETSFSNDTAFAAAKSTFEGAKMGVEKGGGFVMKKAAGAVDKRAARTVEKSRRARQAAESRGETYKPSRREQAAEYYLKKRGILAANGADTEKYGKLLEKGAFHHVRTAYAEHREQKLFNKIDKKDTAGSWKSDAQRKKAFEKLGERSDKAQKLKDKDLSRDYTAYQGRVHKDED